MNLEPKPRHMTVKELWDGYAKFRDQYQRDLKQATYERSMRWLKAHQEKVLEIESTGGEVGVP